MPKSTKPDASKPFRRASVKRWGAEGLDRVLDNLPKDMTLEEFWAQFMPYLERNKPQRPSQAERLFARARRLPEAEKEFLLRLLVSDLYPDENLVLAPAEKFLQVAGQ